jgi:putative sterol carrier protein
MALLSLPMMIKAFAWMANRNEKAKAMIRGSKTIQLEVEGEPPICIHLAENKVTYEKGRAEKPNVVLRTTRENIIKMLSGELRQDEAFTFKKIEVAGSVADAMRFNQIAQTVMPPSSFLVRIVKALA